MIELVLPYPISANRYWASRVVTPKGGGRPMAMTYVTPEAREYREKVAWIARAAGIRAPLTGRLRVHVMLFPHRPLDWKLRMRKLGEWWDDSVQCIDLGNAEKVAGDALQGTVYANDRTFRRIVLDRMEPDANGERLVVRIKQVERQAKQCELLTRDLLDEAEVPF